ncbi:MAG TPA: glycosyltransferase family 87 protein [Ktedonobacteraceae bacterium]
MSVPLTPLLPQADLPPLEQSRARLWLRSLGLAACFFASGALYLWLGSAVPADPNSTASTLPFVHIWLLAYIPYALACALILCTRPAPGRWRRREFWLILGGALLLRLLLLDLPPNLSHDSWRYVWDARIFLHGYSPYVTAPGAPELVPLRDFIYAYSRFRNTPSIYPPGAQYVYALSYLLAPSNLFFLKGIFVLFDLVGCLALALLLARRELDPARVLLYAWSPLPIVEFALEGHLDGVAIAFSLLAVLSAARVDWKARAFTGFLVGLGTLVKIYPLVLLVALVNPRQWKRELALVLACVLTISVAYIPFVLLGHGQVFGFFSTFASEQGQNAGLVQHFVGMFGSARHLPLEQIVAWEHGVALLLLLGTSLAILLARARGRMSIEAGTLVLFSLVLSVSSHVFPWYVTTLLPWVVLLLPARVAGSRSLLLSRVLVLGALWLFTFTSAMGYGLDWPAYYLLVDGSLTVELLAAGLLALLPFWLLFARKGWVYVKEWFGRAAG